MQQLASIRVACFCLLATCGALCQNGHPVTGGHHGPPSKDASPLGVVSKPLPDAPSAQVLSQAERLQIVSNGVALPYLPSAASPAGLKADVGRETHPGVVLPEAPSATLLYRPVEVQNVEVQNKADAFLGKFLDPSKLNQASRYQPSSHDKLMERATDAASRVFVTRDESGRRMLNTPYFLRVLTSVAAGSASRRYRARSSSVPLSDFGSTIGSDAGMNLLHEFGPGIRQVLTSHMPGFVFRIQDRAVRAPGPRPTASPRAR
jgi:hypothetical protein